MGGTTKEFVPAGKVANTQEQFPDLDDDDDQPKKKKGLTDIWSLISKQKLAMK